MSKEVTQATQIITPTGGAAGFWSDIVYDITVNMVGGHTSDLRTMLKTSSVIITLYPDWGFSCPDTITVVGAEYEYDPILGKIVLFRPVSDITIDIICVYTQFPINYAIENGSVLSSQTTMTIVDIVTGHINTNPGYVLPHFLTGENVTVNYIGSTGNFLLSNCTGPVTVTGICPMKTPLPTPTIYFAKDYAIMRCTDVDHASHIEMYVDGEPVG